MKRVVMLLAAGALILGLALPAKAQAPTVSFGGQMRVYGFAFDNMIDFKDSKAGSNRDSQSFYFQRFRLFTTIESADKKAKAYWALEIGDLLWGGGGGAASDLYGCQGDAPGVTVVPTVGGVAGTATVTPGGSTRVNRGSGACAGNDGVNVETKNLYLWLDTGGLVPGTSVLAGIHNILFMTSPLGAFMDDDAAGIQVNWKMDPVDLQLYTIKLSEGKAFPCGAGQVGGANNCLDRADDSDMYVARLGVNVTPDLRLTLEGMLIDQRGLAGQSIGDTFWVGGTAAAKVGTINLDGMFVYGQRAVAAAAGATCGNASNPCEESGWGAFGTARFPVGPVNLFVAGWYTTGDKRIGPATNGSSGGASVPPPLIRDSDKLPIPLGGASYNAGPYIAEWLFGNPTIGAPGVGQRQYSDPTGTYGIGASVTWALTPSVTLGGGAGYVLATDAKGPYGDNLFEIDAGLNYRHNPNLVINLFGGYLVPDKSCTYPSVPSTGPTCTSGDNAWAIAVRTQFAF